MLPVAQGKLTFADRTILLLAISPIGANTTIHYTLHHSPYLPDYAPFYSSNGQMSELTRDILSIITKDAL